MKMPVVEQGAIAIEDKQGGGPVNWSHSIVQSSLPKQEPPLHDPPTRQPTKSNATSTAHQPTTTNNTKANDGLYMSTSDMNLGACSPVARPFTCRMTSSRLATGSFAINILSMFASHLPVSCFCDGLLTNQFLYTHFCLTLIRYTVCVVLVMNTR
jgi:hypothetical protein